MVRFELPARGPYTLRVLDLRGRAVRHLAAATAGPGPLQLRFDGRDDAGRSLASGVYTFVLEAGAHRAQARAVLLK
jgi:hypothetical protein